MFTYKAFYTLSPQDMAHAAKLEATCKATLYYCEVSNGNFPCFHAMIDDDGNWVSYLSIYVTKTKSAELSGGTIPEHRNKGLFKELVKNVAEILAKNDIKTAYSEFNPSLSYLTGEYAYSDLLMRKKRDTIANPIPLTFSVREFDRSIGNDIDIAYIGYVDSIPAGHLRINGEKGFVCLHSMKVRKSYRGQSYGLYLLRAALENFFNRHDCDVYLHVSTNNEPALKLYQTCGFETKEELKMYRLAFHNSL